MSTKVALRGPYTRAPGPLPPSLCLVRESRVVGGGATEYIGELRKAVLQSAP